MLNGKPVVSFNISRAQRQSDLSVYDGSWAELRKLEEENPKVRFVEIANTVDYTTTNMTAAMHALIEGAILAVFVVFLFLGDGARR